MSQFEKLLQRIRSLDKNMRYREIKKILEAYGYVGKETGGGSSHITFRKQGKPSITVPRHGSIKTVYVEMVRDVILSQEEER